MSLDQAQQEQLRQWERDHLWYPFTQMATLADDPPPIIVAADGMYLIDADGQRYLDGVGSMWVSVHGHRVGAIDAAIADQLEHVAHTTLLGLTHPAAIMLAKALVDVAPEGLSRVFYSDTGACAVEIAVKMAYQYGTLTATTERRHFFRLNRGYHGDTIGAVSVGGIDLFHATYRPLLFPTIAVESPYCYRCPWGQSYPGCNRACFDHVAEVVSQRASEACGFIMEPLVQGAGGMITLPPGYTAFVRELTARHGVPLILDEVATGFGRTGTLFAAEREHVQPDFMAVSKGLSGGYLPIAATLVREEIFQAFLGSPERTFFHGHTYTGNPLAARAALANLELMQSSNLIAELPTRVNVLAAALAALARLPHVGEVRQCGMMVGVELVADRETTAPYPGERRMGARVCQAVRRRGAFIRPLGDVVVLMPPLAMAHDQLHALVAMVGEAITEVTGTA